MIFYEYIKMYASLLSERERLKKLLQKLQPYQTYTRNSGGKTYYCLREKENGIRRAHAISRKDYFIFAMENYRYQKARDELKEIEKFLKEEESRYRLFLNKIEKYDKALRSISKHQQPGEPSDYKPYNLRYTTLRGEKVRSKSEAVICDALYIKGINYAYEHSFKSCPFLPDFYIKDNIHGKPIIWEHFGLTDDEDYAQKCIEKLKYYSKNGYILNDNLIITFEQYVEDGEIRYFDSAKAEDTVKRFFTPQFLAA